MKKLKKALALSSILIVCPFCHGGNIRAAQAEDFYINGNMVNVREGPGMQFPITVQASKGEKYTILQEKDQWVYIQTGSGNKGWVADWLIQQDKPSTENTAEGWTTPGITNVRADSTINSAVLGRLAKNTPVKIQLFKHEWAKINFKGQTGWIQEKYLSLDKLDKNESETGKKEIEKNEGKQFKSSKAIILYKETNIRSRPDVHSAIVARTQPGESYPILSMEDEWYKIQLEGGMAAYVAGWVVSIDGNAPKIEKHGMLSDKLIVLDPGHGGRDRGTTGFGGTIEKALTLESALLVKKKLESAGAKVILTRSEDTYISLPGRVRTSHMHNADAFISLHYDSSGNEYASGVTSYYYHSYQKELAEVINSSLNREVEMNDRGTRFGDFHVIRENQKAATIIELGYLSNPAEELKVTSSEYQETVSSAIFDGLLDYFR
ncbi:N-acetylmuramoyl-L-alanine amidase [Peribacillus sp. SCS-155]|uniref:N-acetylmuramoyl-L-alanine amidase n=1 Tax=Peribacillus sedimenti TaxID=3115297 RepID=UPI0039065600